MGKENDSLSRNDCAMISLFTCDRKNVRRVDFRQLRGEIFKTPLLK